MMLQAGFNLPYAEQKAPVAAMRFDNPLQLDSIKTFYGYNPNVPADSTPLYLAIFSYPQPTVLVESDLQFAGNVWVKVNRSTTTSDNLDRVVEVLVERFNTATQTYKPESRLLAYPHEDSPSQLDSFFVSSWDTDLQVWSPLVTFSNVFDAQDRLQEAYTTLYYFAPPLLLKDIYTYDANGDNTLITSLVLLDGGVEVPDGKQELQYQNHLQTQVISYVTDLDGTEVPGIKTTNTYTSFDKVEQTEDFTWVADSSVWSKTNRASYIYDGAQRLSIHDTEGFENDVLVGRYRVTYAYILDENISLESSYYWTGSAFELDTRRYYYYTELSSSASDLPNAVFPLRVTPNPASDVVQIALDGPAVVQLFSANGMLINSISYEAEKTVQLQGLPVGLYFIKAISGDKVYAGRVVKQ